MPPTLLFFSGVGSSGCSVSSASLSFPAQFVTSFADGTIRIDLASGAFFGAGADNGRVLAVVLQQRHQVGFIYGIQEICLIAFFFLVQQLVIVNDDIQRMPISGFHGDKLLICVFIIEKIAGRGDAVLGERSAGTIVVSSGCGSSCHVSGGSSSS